MRPIDADAACEAYVQGAISNRIRAGGIPRIYP